MKNFLFLILVLGLVGCGGGSGGNDGGKIVAIDIKNASSLYITGGASASSVNVNETGDVSKLFKITPEGYVHEVTYTDENNNDVTNTVTPTAVYNVNDSYVLISFDIDSYLVRKSDGAAYIMNGAIGSVVNNFKNSKPIMPDLNGNIYYYGSDVVYKISNIDTDPVSKIVTPETDRIDSFTIDNLGNIFYSAMAGDDNYVTRIVKGNGGLTNLNPYYSRAFWTALDGKGYYLEDTGYGEMQVVQVNIDSNYNVTKSNYGPVVSDLYFSTGTSFLFNFSTKTIIVDANDLNLLEVYNASSTPIITDLGGTFDSISTVAASSDYYYVAGTNTASNPVLKKCSPSTHTCSDLLTPGKYDIYTMVVSDTNEVTFNALRMSDGAKIMAKTSNGTVTVLDATLNNQVTMLERVGGNE